MSQPLEERIAELKTAITVQDGLRGTLGDTVVDATIAALRSQLARLEAQAAPSEEQRKQVTVLFCDLVGFTSMADKMDPEDVREVLNLYFAPWRETIDRHGGKLEKFIGDAVMAVFGVPTASEQDPENAIRAALATRDGLDALNDVLEQQYDIRLAMRVGINTGPVLVGAVGREGDFAVTGDTVNLASRLEGAAPVNGILISHDTYRHVRGVFDVQPQEPLTVKGKLEPVQTYIVQRAKPRAFRMATRGVEGIETHMVGRDAEMMMLQNAFQDAVEDAETRVVTIVGEAGVGKSRLLHEFEQWLELRPERIYYFKGRATPEMLNVSYSVVRDMFAFRFDIRESDSAATALAKFRSGMTGILEPDQADLIGHLVGFDFSASPAVQNLLGGESFGQLAIAYLTNYVRAAACDSPSVVFLEDLHWADDSSLDLVDHLAAEIPNAKLLITCLARPTLFEQRPSWGEGQETHSQIELRPLSRRASRALVSEILQKADQVPSDLRDRIVDSAEGNPYYVEELIKMMMEEDVIVPGRERWHIELGRLAGAHVPPTLTGVLQARLDGLPRKEREVLQRASVVGRLFWDTAVVELATGEAEDEMGMLLEALRQRELIFRREHSTFEGANEYTFKHAILRDVTYETVLHKLRRRYHAQVAAWLEDNAGERIGEYLRLIAGHYERAGERARAAEYLRRSGEEARKTCAYRDAIDAFGRALALAPEGETMSRAALLTKLGDTYVRVGDYDLARQHLEQSLALARELGDRPTEVAALNGLGRAALFQGVYKEAKTRYEEALALAREIDDQPNVATALRALSAVAGMWEEHQAAERYATDGLAASRKIGDRFGISGCLNHLGNVAAMQGKNEAAKRYYEESLAIFKEIGDRWGFAGALLNLGNVAAMQGKNEAAKRYYEESLAISKEIGARREVAVGQIGRGNVAAAMGESQAAWRRYRAAMVEAMAIGTTYLKLEVVVGVAGLWAKSGQLGRAAEWLGLALGHPATYSGVEHAAQPILTTLRDQLPAEELEAALERGKGLNLEQVVAEIVAEAE